MRTKAIPMENNGISMELSIDMPPLLIILAGWWRVFHHSTEKRIIGIFTKPINAIIAHIFLPFSLLL